MLSVIAAQNRNSPAQVVQKCARRLIIIIIIIIIIEWLVRVMKLATYHLRLDRWHEQVDVAGARW